jgi:predicted XRE-type DNA-binding protein
MRKCTLRVPIDTVEQILSHCKKVGDCMVWDRFVHPDGYPVLSRRGKAYKIHRIMFEKHNKRSADGLIVCHKCDNRACVNPEHLFAGTIQDNMDDRNSKLRFHKKLTPEQVVEMRGSELSQVQLAKKYGVDQSTVSDVIRGKSWKALIPVNPVC